MKAIKEVVVLLVDDRSDSFVVVGRLLEMAGLLPANIHWKSNAYFDTLDIALLGSTIDVLFIDLSLPGGDDGYMLLTRLRRLAILQETRFVAITGHVSPEAVKRAREVGFDGFLSKPLDFRQFPVQLKRILAGEAVWDTL